MRKKGNDQVRISQCMIVKNEEKNIVGALSWGKGIVSEQIVVDTGSTDRTVELAKSMGATVYHFDWIDDFAAAKNYAISKANGEWIAFLDADENFNQEDAAKLELLLQTLHDQKSPVEGICTSWPQIEEGNRITVVATQMRVFRNLKGLGYHRRIHEYLGWEDGHDIKILDATEELSVFHTGYRDEGWNVKKTVGRNRRLIQKELEEHPDDVEMLGYLGEDYLCMDEKEEAKQCFQKAVDRMPEQVGEYDQCSTRTLLLLLQLLTGEERPDEDRIEKLYQKAARLLPKEADFDYCYGKWLGSQERYEEAKRHLEQALDKLEQFGSLNRAFELGGKLTDAYEDLAYCCVQTGDRKRAVELSVAVVKVKPDSIRAIGILLLALRGEVTGLSEEEKNLLSVSPEQAAGVLEKLLDFDSFKGRYYVLRAALQADWNEMAQYMERLFSPEEKEQLKQAGLC